MKINHKLAELVGILLGDGYINYPSQPRIKISFNSIDDRDYLLFVREFLKDMFDANIITKHRNNENTSELYLFKRSIIRELVNKFDLIPSPKWERARIPNWIFNNHLEKYVLRGYFDTDGCVVITNNNGTTYPRLEMKISPSPMQKQFIDILNQFDFNFGVYNIGKGKVRIQMNGKKELAKWVNKIGFSNSKHNNKAKRFF